MRKTLIRIVIVGVVLGPAIAIGLYWHNHYAVEVHTHTVSVGDLTSGVTVSGTIRYTQRAALAAEVIAAVRSLPVEEGQHVSKGEILVQLDDDVLAAENAKAQAQVELASRKLAELRAGARKEEITKANEQVNSARADMDYADKENKRIVEARQTGAATESEMNQAANKLANARSSLGQAQAHLTLLKTGAREEEIASAQAEVNLAKAELKRCHALRMKYVLRSPHDGELTARYVNVGEVVSPGQVLLRIGNTKAIEIRAQVQESQLQGVKVGSKAYMLADSYPDTILKAVVRKILSRVDPERGTITVILELTDPPAVKLMDGMAVDINIVDQEGKDVLLVPAAAIEGKGDSASVFVRRNGKFTPRAVTVGISDGYWTEIKVGLKAGDEIRLP